MKGNLHSLLKSCIVVFVLAAVVVEPDFKCSKRLEGDLLDFILFTCLFVTNYINKLS